MAYLLMLILLIVLAQYGRSVFLVTRHALVEAFRYVGLVLAIAFLVALMILLTLNF